MKSRRIDTNKIEVAKEIIHFIAETMNLRVEQIESRSHKGKLPYARQLMVYFIRNENLLQCDVIAPMLGWRPDHSLVSRCYRKIKDMIEFDDQVRNDVNLINEILKQKEAA